MKHTTNKKYNAANLDWSIGDVWHPNSELSQSIEAHFDALEEMDRQGKLKPDYNRDEMDECGFTSKGGWREL